MADEGNDSLDSCTRFLPDISNFLVCSADWARGNRKIRQTSHILGRGAADSTLETMPDIEPSPWIKGKKTSGPYFNKIWDVEPQLVKTLIQN